MKALYLASSALALSTASVWADGHAAPVSGYALAGGGSTLLVMTDVSAPTDIASFDLGASLDAIAWRPVTGDLLGLADGAIYLIDPTSGEMTDLEASFADDAMLSGDATAFDFNNQIDAVRAVSSAGENLVYFPDGFGDGDDRAGSVLRFTDLAYGEGDAHEGTTPMIFANAYTNAVNGMTASETFQYAIDAETDALVSLANNAGTLTTIAAISVDGQAVDLAPMGGFDIVSPGEGDNTALAILQMSGSESAGLYTLDLETGAATLNADLGTGGITGFAASLGM
ncbi:DUF4394 domain-containing protein [Jannaschia sp. CCS1]|uniref:DUF4394 domain-containing protein n=1 Tax=Jannaschia sp. (strain CCS1) TaxID=290400 RepID=UPI000053CFC4|nr:DUF4394 domain-containing protein [Jannaschia sp. CCS1]ABD53564.1 hypothetical protein Jann_0647 [Jannaschia sp. CCS1]